MKSVGLSLLAVLAFSGVAAAPAAKMPITAWGWSLKYDKGEVTQARYHEIAEAGFTVVLQWVPDDKAALRILDMAEKAGIKVLLHFHPIIAGLPKSYVDAVKNHPALDSYYVWDEPDSIAQLEKLAPIVKNIQTWDPDHHAYVNALGKWEWDGRPGAYGMPDGNYEAYLESFFRHFDWKVIRQDTYPVFSSLRFQERPFRRPRGPLCLFEKWFPTLETVKKVAERHNVPHRGFVLCCAIRNHPCFDNPLPAVSHMKLQAYANIAYGAQGLEYYKYRMFDSGNYAPLDRNLKRTAVFDRCRKVNLEIQARAGCFLGAKLVKVRHAAKVIPALCTKFDEKTDLPPFATHLWVDRHAVISHFRKGGRDVLLILNADPNDELTLRLDVKPGTVRVMEDGRHTDPSLYDGEYWLGPGDAEVFMGAPEE